MANIYPQRLPNDAPASEKKVIDALGKLPNSYTIFHGVNWLNLNPKAKQRVGETDLIILHPKYGILVVEIKGGGIRVEGGDWYSVDRYGDSHRLSRSPALQARGNLYLLKEKLETMRVISPAAFEQGLMGYAVWFPDIDKADATLPMDIDPALVLDGQSLYTPIEGIEMAFRKWRNHPTAELDKMQVAKIRQIVSPDTLLVPSLHLRLRQQEEELIELTSEQQHLFAMIQSNSRLLVSGGAGTGKTLLAIEDAKFQAGQGRKTLLLCFNKLLASYLTDSVSDEPNITAASFHNFANIFCTRVGIPFEAPADPAELTAFFTEMVPELLMQAASISGEKFDALIVDEAQDFLSDWWLALDELLAPAATFHCFHDANQAIFQKGWEPPFSGPTFGPLNVNCRNTSPIGEMARMLGKVNQDQKFRAVEGVEPTVIRYKVGPDIRQQVVALLQIWIEEGKVDPKNIVILSPFKRERSLLGVEKIGKWKIHDLLPGEEAEGITFATIHAFKGLEADAIIIADLDGSPWAMNPQSLYVAASRAKHLLAICSHESTDVA